VGGLLQDKWSRSTSHKRDYIMSFDGIDVECKQSQQSIENKLYLHPTKTLYHFEVLNSKKRVNPYNFVYKIIDDLFVGSEELAVFAQKKLFV